MITIQGKGVSAGVGVGPLYFYRRATAEIKRYTAEDTDAEWHRFKGAQTGAIEQLGVLAEQARKEAGDEAAMLFETHQMMAEDLDFEEAIEDRIVNQKMNAEAAVSDTSEQFAEMFASMDDAYMQARAADVKDVSQRILGILCGIVQGGIASDVPVLLCADDLAPSETIQLDKSKVLGFITAGGSGSSHTAILARTLGIPAIVGMGDALKPELEGRAAIADGSTGALVIDPDDDTRDRLLKKRDEQLRLQRLLETLKGQANVTKDGKTIRIYCNIGSPEDVHAVQVNDGGGIGLFRSEFLFIGNAEPPSVEEQTKAYAELLAQFPGKKVVIRMLDAGADKPLPFLTPEDEPNPALGLRGLRTLRTHMNVLEGQLKALAAADAQTDADLWVMAPMVADAHEAAYFVKLGKSFGLKKVGVMAEVPSIALMADQVAKVADFVSIGTNDLTQYTLAADRTLGSVANYQTAWHPAVLRAIKMICDAGNAKGMPVGVCGEAAADPDLAVVLTGIGVNSLSMTPVALDDVRAELAGVTLEEAQEKAAKALNGDFYNPSEWNI